jgi:dUTP pyrophosphatase
MILKFKKLHEDAITPTQGSEHAAGYDLYALENAHLHKDQVLKVHTGIAIQLPEGYFGAVCPRSGLAVKGVTVYNAPGIVDSDYIGEICVLLTSNQDDRFLVEKGMRIGQLVIQQHFSVQFEEVSELTETDRGDGGFGSSGV